MPGLAALQDMELQQQKAEKSARQQLARKLSAQAKVATKAKSKSEPSCAPGGKKIKKGGDADDLSSMPHDKQIEVLQAKINQEKELEKLISSCSTHIKLPDKLPITRICASDKVKGAASKSKQLEQQLQRTKAAQAAQAQAQEDVTVEFGYKVWKDHSAELAGRVVNQHICHMPPSKHSKTCKYQYIYIYYEVCLFVCFALRRHNTTMVSLPKAFFTSFWRHAAHLEVAQRRRKQRRGLPRRKTS